MKRNSNALPAAAAMAAFATMSCLGCGSAASKGVTAIGTVTLDGKPVRNATALFTPQDPAGHSVSVRVVDGKFQFDETAGLAAGAFDVCVIAAEPEFEEVEAAHREGEASPLKSSRIPTKYQRPGELTATVTEAGPNQFDFALSSRAMR